MSIREEVLDLLLRKSRRESTELIVNEIMNERKIYSTRDDKSSEMWIYEDGIYIPQGRTFIKEFVRNILGEVYTTTLCNEVMAKIEADTFIDQQKFFENNYIEEIPVQNGILNIFKKELTPFTPDKIFFTKLPIKFDSNAKCEEILKFLKEVVRNEEDVKVILEFFGYCLLKEYKLERAFMFLGNGRNGKGKTLSLLKMFLGLDSISSVPLSQLKSDSFSVSELHKKLANIAGDLSNTDLKETGMLKALTGRDPIAAKRKFLNDVKFVNYTKLIFACNDLPRVYDTSIGFWERWVLLEFPYQFVKKQHYDQLSKKEKILMKIDDPDIIQKIVNKEELSGLLNMALESLEFLLENKDFSYTKGSKEVKDFWVRKSDSFMAFCMDCLVEDVESVITKKELRRQYSRYCKLHKVRGVSDKSILITLQELFGVIDEYIKNPMTEKQDWSWVGIKIKVKGV